LAVAVFGRFPPQDRGGKKRVLVMIKTIISDAAVGDATRRPGKLLFL